MGLRVKVDGSGPFSPRLVQRLRSREHVSDFPTNLPGVGV